MPWQPRWAWFFGFCTVAIVYIIISGLGLLIDGERTRLEVLENAEWVATSNHWLDRQACNWLGLCGLMHLNSRGWTWTRTKDDIPQELPDFRDFWQSGEEQSSWSAEERQRREIPQYVFDHAPYVHLFSGEEFWPSDVAEHLVHVSPTLNYTIIDEMADNRNLTNLHDLDEITEGKHGRFVYLQSDENVEEWPDWLTSRHNIPYMPEMRETPWPHGPDEPSPASDEQQLLRVPGKMSSAKLNPQWTFPWDLEPSVDGRCGGNTGSTCKRSKFGGCCSMHGWCGAGDEYCGDYCDPLHGTCYDPLHPPPGPKIDLRRRRRAVTHAQKESNLGKSKAPAILIVADKGNGTVDAFWFFFYSFNLGQKVFGIRFGNHVGDWEHTMIRFKHGKPESVFLSEHDFGDAYTWDAMEKYLPNPDGSETMLGTWSNRTAAKAAKRPVVYSAVGSHAMYGKPGLHPYVLPFGLLHDQTDRGPLWDPALNVQSYSYHTANKTLRASTLNPRSPTAWLDYAGHWGDKYYPLSDPRQYRFAGQYHYVNGPTGPKFKRLGREQICQGHGTCNIRSWLGGERLMGNPPEEDEEDGGLPGGNSTDDTP
jgi:hypothetical protein